MNLIIMVKIMRILKKKQKERGCLDKEDSANNTLSKAVLSLSPLLGLQSVLMPHRLSCRFLGVNFARFINNLFVIIQALTGFFIALLFCFSNTETRIALARWIKMKRSQKPNSFWVKMLHYLIAYTFFFYRKRYRDSEMSLKRVNTVESNIRDMSSVCGQENLNLTIHPNHSTGTAVTGLRNSNQLNTSIGTSIGIAGNSNSAIGQSQILRNSEGCLRRQSTLMSNKGTLHLKPGISSGLSTYVPRDSVRMSLGSQYGCPSGLSLKVFLKV